MSGATCTCWCLAPLASCFASGGRRSRNPAPPLQAKLRPFSRRCGELSGERVLPSQLGKSSEIPIHRAQDQSVLDGQCSQISIMDEVRPDTGQGEQLTEASAMLLGRLWHPNRAAAEPGDDLVPGLRRWGRPAEHTRVRDDAQERQNTRPWQSDANSAIKLSIKPIPDRCMLHEPARIRHRSGCWHRRGSTKRVALDQRQHLGDVVNVVYQHSSRIEGACAEWLSQLRLGGHLV